MCLSICHPPRLRCAKTAKRLGVLSEDDTLCDPGHIVLDAGTRARTAKKGEIVDNNTTLYAVVDLQSFQGDEVVEAVPLDCVNLILYQMSTTRTMTQHY